MFFTKPFVHSHLKVAASDHTPTSATYRRTRFYINDTLTPITITERTGMRLEIPREPNSMCTDSFSICDMYEFENIGHIDALSNFLNARVEAIGVESHPDLALVADFVRTRSFNGFSNGRFNIVLRRAVSHSELSKSGNIFVHSMDVMVSHPSFLVAEHPQSQAGMAGSMVAEGEPNHFGKGVYIEIVDNNREIDTRFVYICGRIVEVVPTKDPARGNGAYFTEFQDNKDGTRSTHTEHRSIDKITDFGLYSTREEAETNGNPDALIKARLLEADRELNETRRTNEAALMKMRVQLAEAEANAKTAAAKADRKLKKAVRQTAELKERMAQRSAERSDYYEARSSSRKDSSEMWKMAPVALGLALGLGAALLR